MTAVLLVHGRSQEMAAGADRSETAVAAYVESRKREWLAGLARGRERVPQGEAAK